jgi:hypothetical protein
VIRPSDQSSSRRKLALRSCYAFLACLSISLGILPSAMSQDTINDGYQPTIYTITPSTGSILGGTSLRIYGTNFQPSGLFSQVLVFVGTSLCHVVGYYTTNEQINCVVPACTADRCLSQLEYVYPYESVGVNVYVYTVRGIFSAQTSFTYSYWDTSYISSLTRNLWATSTGEFTGYMYTDQLNKIDVTFEKYHADLGTNDLLNPEYPYFTSSSSELFYYPPYQIPAGYYNSTITLSNPDSQDYRQATGYANFFPDKESKSLYTTTMSGTAYLVAIYPVVQSISPAHGSLAGGTLLTITGSGFNNDTSTLSVLVGGIPCQVVDASIDSISCVTGSILSDEAIEASYQSSATDEPYLSANLSYGSPGIFFKLYSFNDYLAQRDKLGYGDAYTVVSFPWRQDALLSFWNMYGNSNWPSILNVDALNLPGNVQRYGAQAATIFRAPVAGYYRFYMAVDDFGSLYGSYDDIGINEAIIASVPGYSTSYYNYASQISKPIYLQEDQRYYLRSRYLNSGYQDYFALAVKITPNESAQHVNESWSDILRRHASIREVQTVAIDFDYAVETQEIVITSARSGNFYLLIQGEALTTALPLTSTISTITNAMRTAVNNYISPAKIECNNFGGTITTSNGIRRIRITFNCDTTDKPLTLLQIISSPLIGYSNMTTSIRRLNTHTPIPAGTFDLNVNGILVTKIPFDSNNIGLRDLINKQDFSNDVMVSYSQWRYHYHTWTITFVRPRGDVPTIELDISGITGPNRTVSVTTSINGSADEFFFDPLPLWMTEIPRTWAAGVAHGSGVEVYQTLPNNDIMKAICDESNDQGNAGYAFFAQTKGSETSCSYHYLKNDTAMVMDYNMKKYLPTIAAIPIYTLTITGVNFLVHGPSTEILVTIGNQTCELIAKATDQLIVCNVTRVARGEYYPIVNIVGAGDASRWSNQTLIFEQVITSITPPYGSFAGGQVITITGYGFHSDDAVVNLTPGGSCEILTRSYDKITCITPAIPIALYPTMTPSSIPSPQPSSEPTVKPTISPSARPSTEPSIQPTALPSTEPSIQPTAYPTDTMPSLSPTNSPTEEPSSPETDKVPTHMPTEEPSSLETHKVPTHMPTEEPASSRRRLLLGDEPSLVMTMVQVDNITAASSFAYSADYTPRVSSISPDSLSTAISTTVLITGSNLFSSLGWSSISNSTVRIGDRPCIVKNISYSMIECFYIRSGASPVTAVVVKVTVVGLGYAAYQSSSSYDLSSLPTATVGYAISSTQPLLASINGGTTITFTGFGFSYTSTTKTTISFADSVGQTTYAQLVDYLGLVDVNINKHFQDCLVTAADFYSLTCELEALASPITTADNPILATVTLNNYNPYYQSLDNITVIQTRNVTPIVSSISSTYTYLASDAITQVTAFNITGSLLTDGIDGSVSKINVSYSSDEAVVCSYQTIIDAAQLYVSCNNLPAGDYQVKLLSPAYGYATIPSSYVASVILSTSSITFDTSIGSVGGGTRFVLTGYGFHPNCDLNVISFNLGRGYALPVKLTSCSVTTVVGYTPSLVTSSGPVSSSAGTIASGYQESIIGLSVYVRGYSSSLTQSSISFSYDYDYTANIIRFSPTNGYENTVLTILFSISSKLKSPSYSVRISKQDLSCSFSAPSALNASLANITATCLAPAVTAGKYSLQLILAPYGLAATKRSTLTTLPAYTSNLRVMNLTTPYYSSTQGGYQLVITGQGLSKNMTAKVCGDPCVYLNSSYNSYTCAAPKHITTEYIDSLSMQDISIDLVETLDSTTSSKYSVYASTSGASSAFDNSYYTYFQFTSSSSSECYIGIRMLGQYRIQPFRMRYYPRYQYATSIQTHYFEGSTDNGVTYQILATGTSAKEGWNYLTADSQTGWYTHLRYHSINDKYGSVRHCPFNEIKFLGTIASTIIACPIRLSSGPRLFAPGYLNYSIAYTPVVRAVSPLNGSSLGNTTLTLTGDFFTSMSDTTPTVLINSIACEVVTYGSSSITCITGRRPSDNIQENSISVLIPKRGYAIVGDNVQFTYLDRWSELTTWRNQEPPVDGDFVVIPQGQTILLDVDTPILKFLLIQGQLYLDSAKPSISIDAYYIFVYGGLLQIGTASQPYESQVTITLHGKRFGEIEVPEIGSKCLVVASTNLPKASQDTGIHIPAKNIGQLEIHGKKRLRTWTFLSTSVKAGTTIIALSEAVDYQPGEKLVIAGTGLAGSQPNYGIDEVVVAELIDAYHIRLASPLLYDHYSEILTIDGERVDMRCEIGLLSRNIVIQGDDYSDYELFGVHTVARYASVLRLENIELRRCGQAFVLGRYCSHSHKSGNMETSYVRANSIHHSYQRAVTTHATFYWEVRDNVAYHVMGHTYFVEDGNEQYNLFTGNLGIRTIKSSAGITSDTQPAVYWTSNPTNFWYDNHGANSDAHGHWFELPGTPNNYLANGYKLICPVHGALGAFGNNTFHSNSAHGLRIYPQWTPFIGTGCESSTPAPQYLYNLTTFSNGGNGLFSKRHGDLHHHNLKSLANGGDDVFIVRYQDVVYTHDPAIKHALVVGAIDSTQSVYKLALNLPQYEYFYLSDVKIVNYGTQSYAIAGCNECDSPNMFHQGGFTTRFQKLQFINSPRRVRWNPHKKEIFYDLDGSLTGTADAMLSRFWAFNNWTSGLDAVCSLPDSYVYESSILCTNKTKIRRMSMDNFTPYTLQVTPITIHSDAGSMNVPYLPRDTSGWVFPLVNQHNYRFAFDVAKDSVRTWDLRYGVGAYLYESYLNNINESLIMNYISNSYDYRAVDFVNTLTGVTYYASKNISVGLSSSMGSSFYNTSNRQLDLVFSNIDANYNWGDYAYQTHTEARLCPPGGCPIPPKASLKSFGYWSDNTTWIGYGGKPKAGADFNISAELWVVLDEATPRFGCITIYGRVSFLSGSNKSLGFDAECIVVYGTLEINGRVTVENGRSANNSVNDPFRGSASITIHGSRLETIPQVLGEGLFLGSKLIAVAGTLTAIGKPVVTSHVTLNQTALSGSNTLIVTSVQALDKLWLKEQEISISPTGYFTETGTTWDQAGIESKTIASIVSTKLSNNLYRNTITTTAALTKTYACLTRLSESFCASVGLLSRNIVFKSTNFTGTIDEGFGGHIAVVDILDSSGSAAYIGNLHLEDIQMQSFGKLNGDHYAISIQHRGYYISSPAHIIRSCVFANTLNMAIHIDKAINVTIAENLVMGSYAGGIYISENARDIQVTHNLVMGIKQNPAVLANGYDWTLPIAAFNFYSYDGNYTKNIAAGSYDSGFMVATSIFSGYDGTQSPAIATNTKLYAAIVKQGLCQNTLGEVPTSKDIAPILAQAMFMDNEAYASRTGMMIVNRELGESTYETCAVVTGFKAWRNAHIGIGGIDAHANHYLHDVVVAENHIGISISYNRVVEGGYSGVHNSKIIGSLTDKASEKCTGPTPAAVGTTWLSQKCQAFSANDPFGFSSQCLSVMKNSEYTRVGVLIPQSTNGAKSCAIGGDVPLCTVPTFPNRLCSLPWEKRYGLPAGYQYVEAHFHDLEVTGFTGISASDCKATYGAAIAINPSQIDTQPVVVSSKITWTGQSTGLMDVSARLGLKISTADQCSVGDCLGLKKLLIHDHQGLLLDTADNLLPTVALRQSIAGKIVYDNPQYVKDTSCRAVTDLGVNIYSCLDTSINNVPTYSTYTALWNNAVDAGVAVVTGPVTIWRGNSLPGYYNLFNEEYLNDIRSYTFFAPKPDFCPDILPTNHFPMLISPGYYHHAITTGEMPISWYIRWDNPNINESAILDIYIRQSNVVNVFVGPSLDGPFTFIKPIYTTPTLADAGGTNARNPQSRNVTVTLRGGSQRYYMFRITPVVAVTIKMEMSLAQFFSNTFIANVATLLQIDKSRIKITDVREGSVIVDFNLEPSVTVATTNEELVTQVSELTTISNTLAQSAGNGALQSALNVTISRLFYTPPPVLSIPGINATSNSTSTATSSGPVNLIGTAEPTREPTVAPTPRPTYPITLTPTADPTLAPTSAPSTPPTPQSAKSQMVIIIVACVVTAGVLLIGAIAGYFMTSRAKLSAVLPSSNLVITAQTTDMDLQRWGTTYNQTADSHAQTSVTRSATATAPPLASAAAAAANSPAKSPGHVGQLASVPPYASARGASQQPSNIMPHQANAAGLNIPINGPAPLPSIPSLHPLNINQSQGHGRSPRDRRWASPRSAAFEVKE